MTSRSVPETPCRAASGGHFLGPVVACGIGGLLWAGGELNAQARVTLQPTAHATPTQLDGLGVVVDAVSDEQGRVFILDASRPGVVVADERLQPLGYRRGGGVGPGAFREPVSVATLEGDRIAVLDRALRRLTVLQVTEAGASLPVETFADLGMSAEGMCSLPDDMFLIYGFHAGDRLHVVDLEGRSVRSFAPADSTRSAMAADLLTYGTIACDRERDEVVVSSRFLPFIEAFRISTGEPLWQATVSPFRRLSVVDNGDAVTIASGPHGYSRVAGLFLAGEQPVVQTIFDARLDNVQADSVGTYVYSIGTRTWSPPDFALPRLFRLADGLVLAVEGRGAETRFVRNRIQIATSRSAR